MVTAPRPSRAPLVLWSALVAFFLLLFTLVGWSLIPRDASEFVPSPVMPRPVPDTLFVDTLTIDARETDQWVFVDLDRRSAVLPPDTAGWDLALRRFEIVTSGAAAKAPSRFDDVHRAPDMAYTPSVFGSDTTNRVLAEWYRYGFVSHLLKPRAATFVLRTRDARYTKLQFLSYYCPELTAGCLTFRYAYQPDGSKSLRAYR